VESSRDHAERLIIDHKVSLSDAAIVATCAQHSDDGLGDSKSLDASKLIDRGVRLTIEVPPFATLEIAVEESNIAKSQVELTKNGSPQFAWLNGYMSQSAGPSLVNHPALLECRRLQQELDAKKQEVAATEQQAEQLKERQERLRKNLTAASQASQSAKWLNDLEVAEEKLVDIEDRQMAELHRQQGEIERQLYESLKSLSLTWSDG
jgi:hypothetical protein